ncbi:MAG TPA: methyltransferase domain-containing protein [Gemmatimonadaceae bacterium]|jgi:2-polyprenyl-3-methyl-5-hydroxy-6-metoxy-1,4-benzoquinol methylase|nr:methyltransferase domain-containing protein [Gemmatimonadaceae bacterium]
MTVDPYSDAKIVESWQRNAAPWADAVRERKIESRTLVTDSAIVEAVLSRSPQTVLDIGCGEGWLARVLAQHAIRVTGVDVAPALIDAASKAGGGDFRVASYELIAAGRLELAPVDVVVANFSLIGKESVDNLMAAVPSMLAPSGALVIQTLHPLVATGDLPYVDGWRDGSWTGFGADFSDPAPWYFRTLETWVTLLRETALRLVEMREPLHPTSQKPASVIFIAQVTG